MFSIAVFVFLNLKKNLGYTLPVSGKLSFGTSGIEFPFDFFDSSSLFPSRSPTITGGSLGTDM